MRFNHHCKLSIVQQVNIGDIFILYYAPMSITIELEDTQPPPWQWKMNESLISDVERRAIFKDELEQYFLYNCNS